MAAERSMDIPRRLLDQYFQTTAYPYTRHHLESYNQFLISDVPAIIRAANPLLILKDLIPGTTNTYEYKVEIFIGGEDGSKLSLGTPTIQHQGGAEIRLLYPNEARLRNLTYMAGIYADILVRVTFGRGSLGGGAAGGGLPAVLEKVIPQYPLFQIPVMLHSKACLLNNKPEEFLKAVGECPYDNGGYFIVGGAEKILITRQEQAFNTLYAKNEERDPQIATFASISCLNPDTRQVKRITFIMDRKTMALQVGLPFVRKPVPLCIVFRALGIESDKEIAKHIFADLSSEEAKLMEPYLVACFTDAAPMLDTYLAIEYIKTLTKGFSEAHVLDILNNQLFVHVPNESGARATFLGDCARKIFRVHANIDPKTDRDDVRNQRCLTSGFLIQQLFQGVYTKWAKVVTRAVNEEYNYNKAVYSGESFMNIFAEGTIPQIFKNPMKTPDMLTNGIMRGFRGKWGTGGGDEKAGVLQAMSRLSYIDFMSHCRRVVLEFDTGQKLTGPRHLHGSQYGYFCTNETPGGASIGISKNLSILAAISNATPTRGFLEWLKARQFMMPVDDAQGQIRIMAVPVFINNGLVGYTLDAAKLVKVIKLLKWTGCLSYSVGASFFIRDRRIIINFDQGRPLRPLIHLRPWDHGRFPKDRLATPDSTWRDMVMGTLPQTKGHSLAWIGFVDPLAEREVTTMENYIEYLIPFCGQIEYLDPYEQNETSIVNYLEQAEETSSHVEVHASSIMSAITTLIPFSNFNQSVRNQLGDSQSKQGLSLYATNWMQRFDSQAVVLTNGAPPLCRTLYYDYLGQGKLSYGNNIVLAMGMFLGYNQDDGIVFNKDAFQRGLFNTVHTRSYNIREEDDELSNTKTRIANPKSVPGWTQLQAGLDYGKLDERGIVKVGEIVDENTVLVGRTMELPNGSLADASEAAKVWTTGRVESVVLTVNNKGLRTVKIRITEYREPELGDKFSNRHGQKGTIGMMYRAHDMPRTKSGIVPDMMMNCHAIPSRMTIGMIMEMMAGKIAANLGAVADGTPFTTDGRITKQMNAALEQVGFEKYGNEIMYDGQSGKQYECAIFIAPVFTMRLKHLTADKWNARGKGRKEQRTHQPTGGRGAQGGLRIGELERDAIVGHGVAEFTRERYTDCSDGVQFRVCRGCGTLPIENPKTGLFICPMCTGPVSFIGSTSHDLEIIPPTRKTMVEPVTIAMPYAFKLLQQEMETYMNISMRVLTEKDMLTLNGVSKNDITMEPGAPVAEGAVAALPERVLIATAVPEYREAEAPVEADPALIAKLRVGGEEAPLPGGEEVVVDGTVRAPTGAEAISIAAAATAAAAAAAPSVAGTMVKTAEGEEVFQPAPTNITIVPPARTMRPTITAVGEGEPLTEFERLGTIQEGNEAGNATVSTVPGFGAVMGGNQQYAMPQQMTAYGQIPTMVPGMYPPGYYGGAPMYPAPATATYGGPLGMNVGGVPQVYAATLPPPPAQIFTTGVPGAPATIAVSTDPATMGAYATNASLPPGPKPRNAFTQRRRNNGGFNGQGPATVGGMDAAPGGDMRVTVNKLA